VTLDEYQAKAFATAQIDWDEPSKRHVPAFGSIGELGSLVSELKKSLRDGAAYTEGNQNLVEEFGDVLWYLAAIASHYELAVSDLVNSVKATRSARVGAFDHIYAMMRAIPSLTEQFQALPRRPTAAAKRKLAASLGTSLAATIAAIRQQKLDLDKVLETNLDKVHGMFGTPQGPARCFDKKQPGYEQLPRKLHVQFLERARGETRLEVILRVHDLNIGDRLTDNSSTDDGYRFHDVFHLAYAAVLGWSPVVRATFRCKRKSVPKIDEIEDGARAAIVEEAIAQTVFNYARGHSMLSGLQRLDHGILKLIHRMVRGLEVEVCALNEWQHAIIVGFSAFRSLRQNRGGWLTLDAETRSLTYSREGPGAA